jgi:hypothetical protein
MASMALMSIRGVDDGIGLYKFLREIVDDTWLERLIDSPMLLINMVAEEGNIDLSNNPKSEELIREFPALINPETLLDRCLKEIMATAPEELGSSHFRIYLLEELNPPKQVLSPDLQPEQVIKHMLKGLESFSIDEKLEWLRTDDTRDSAVSGCNYVIKTLAGLCELDYTAFKGLGSSSVRVLVEAGLDKRKLPRMNGRDKGHLISEELGL